MISGRYIGSSTAEVNLEVTLATGASTKVIVTQHLPAGTEVIRAEPAYTRYNRSTGTLRWLLRSVPPGTLLLRINLAAPLQPGQLRADIRCLDPQSGKMVTIQVP